jgi:formylglycine-generating enzyme required for sulfatase activity
VTSSKPFYIAQFKVTQAQYQRIMGKNPSQHAGADYPVDSVNWASAAEFCKKASEKTKKTIALPTDVQWEFACRAGTATCCYWGDDVTSATLSKYCWWHDNAQLVTHPVGQKTPNAFGLYDMMGLAWEWVEGGGTKAANHPARGATFGSKEPMFRSSIRIDMDDAKVNDRFGMRVVMDAY